ncbi:MAG: flagellar hook-length control protein FliK [Myxococcota bacterium]
MAAEGTATASPPAAAPAPLPEARLPHPLPSPAFAPALGQQVAMWVRQGVPQAMLQLNPAELGPVAVRIALDGTQAHVDFTALHAATRDALEASLPALASALRDSGLTLAGGGVFDRPREQRGDSPTGETSTGGTGAPAAVDTRGEASDARGVVSLRRHSARTLGTVRGERPGNASARSSAADTCGRPSTRASASPPTSRTSRSPTTVPASIPSASRWARCGATASPGASGPAPPGRWTRISPALGNENARHAEDMQKPRVMTGT